MVALAIGVFDIAWAIAIRVNHSPRSPLVPRGSDTESVAGLEPVLGSYGAAGQLQQPPPHRGAILKRAWG